MKHCIAAVAALFATSAGAASITVDVSTLGLSAPFSQTTTIAEPFDFLRIDLSTGGPSGRKVLDLMVSFTDVALAGSAAETVSYEMLGYKGRRMINGVIYGPQRSGSLAVGATTDVPVDPLLDLAIGILTFDFLEPLSTATVTVSGVTYGPQPVPLPAGLPLVLTGLGALAWLRRRT